MNRPRPAAPPPFEAIVAEHGAAVMRVCRGLLPPADAEDAWADTFLSALGAYPALRPDSNVRGWLVTIAHHKAIDVHRRRARAPLPTDHVTDRPHETHATHQPSVDGLDGDVAAALERLPPKQRAAVVYRYLGDLAYADVAALLDSSPAAARRSAADGIAALRATLSKGSTP